MSRVALLDVNFLIALFDVEHVHHDVAHDWFADHRALGWATCPITENGFVRILANPSYRSQVTRASELVSRLRKLCGSGHHEFWDDAISLCDERLFNVTHGYKQLTDIYLLGLATKHGGCLATFDQRIPLGAVKGATRAQLEVVVAVE